MKKNRFIVDERAGCVAVIDTKSFPDTPGLQADLNGVLAYWDGYKLKLAYGDRWEVEDWKIKKAHELCNLLNKRVK